MPPLAARQQVAVGLLLALFMAATRGQHLAALGFLPDASWALFFLAGVYLRPIWACAGFLVEALLLDVAAIAWGGVSGFCFSPAYVLLVPAQGVLWFAGRWYCGQHRHAWSTLLPLAGAVLGGALVAEALASGGFYLFSGRFADPNLAELGARLVRYFPASLEALVLYVGLAALVHLALASTTAAATARGGLTP